MLYDYFLLAFVCAAMNHMGLIAAAEKILGHSLPVLNCAKCSTFWITLGYGVVHWKALVSPYDSAVPIAALSFAFAYVAVWLDLLMGGVDIIYLRIYDAFYPTAAGAADSAPAAETDNGSDSADAGRPDDAMPALREDVATNS